MRVLLTGGTGCVGTALIPQLRAAGAEVIALSRTAVPHANATIIADLTQRSFVRQLPSQCDAVIHAAQSRRYREFPSGAVDIFSVNTAATFHLANYAHASGAKSFIYASTGSVYLPQESPVDEASAIDNRDMYVASKLAGELFLESYAPLMEVLCLRLFYVYGPGQSGTLVDYLATRIRSGDAIDLYGEEGIRTSPTYSEDVARIITKAVHERWTGTLNIASPFIHTIKQIASVIGLVLQKEPKFKQMEEGSCLSLLPDLARMKVRLGGMPFTPLEVGIQRTFGATV